MRRIFAVKKTNNELNMETKNKSAWRITTGLIAGILTVGSLALIGMILQEIHFALPLYVILSVLALLFACIGGVMWLGRLAAYSGYRHHHFSDTHKGAVFALLLVVAGLLLLGFSADVLPIAWKGFFFSWPMLLYVSGAVGVYRFHFFGGGVVMLAGTFFLIAKAALLYPGEQLYDRFSATYWPALVVLAGLAIFFHILFNKRHCRMHHRHGGRHRHNKFHHGYWERKNSQENIDGKINYQSFLGGIEQVILEPVFRGGTLEAVFGGIELDLRHTALPDGDTHLYAKSVFGGIQLSVPPDWYLEIIPAQTLAGGVNDTRVIKNAPSDTEKKLIIMAECMFGGIVIK